MGRQVDAILGDIHVVSAQSDISFCDFVGRRFGYFSFKCSHNLNMIQKGLDQSGEFDVKYFRTF